MHRKSPHLAVNTRCSPPEAYADVTRHFRACGYFLRRLRTAALAAITVTAATAGAEVPVLGEPDSLAVSAFEDAVLTAEVEEVPEETTVEAEVVPVEAIVVVVPRLTLAAAVRAEVTGGSGRSAATAVVGIAGACVTG